MAVRIPTIERTSGVAQLVAWSGLLNNDTGTPVQGAGYTQRTVQITGTFGGASVALQGSNDGINFLPLSDEQGNELAKSTSGLEVITEAPRYIRPVVADGDGTTTLVVTMWARRARKTRA